MVKGSKEPLNIYTVIVQFSHIKETDDRFTVFEKKEKMLQRAQEKRAVVSRVYGEKVESYLIFLKDEDIKELRKNVDKQFEIQFKRGYQSYREGFWEDAGELFESCLKRDPLDGPTLALKSYIESLDYECPRGWECRELLEK